MAVFTSTLPDDLLKRLSENAKKLSVPKNKLLERALNAYLDQINKAEYAKSYKQFGDDEDIMKAAEEGMSDYYKQIEDQ
ncbi:ribbon-helix-helix domain-containing protein [Ekhidna sp.]